MENEKKDKRWYDKDPKMIKILEIIQDLDQEEQENLAINLINLVNAVRTTRRAKSEEEVSLGKERALGLYKAFSKRRWYDRNNSLMSAMNIFATLCVEDAHLVLNGLLIYLGYTEEEIKLLK